MKRLFTFATLILCLYSVHAQDKDFIGGLKAFDSKEYGLSLKMMQPYAEKGNCMAQFIVGFVYEFGLGVPKNDSLGRYWLELAARQKQPLAMGPLAANYFGADAHRKRENMVTAYVWAMLAAEYEPTQKATATRYVIKDYMKEPELSEAEKRIEAWKLQWKDKEDCR